MQELTFETILRLPQMELKKMLKAELKSRGYPVTDMLHKCWTGAYCRYFREAVLPLDPELQAALTTEGISPELRACAVCGKAFLPEGRQAYCSDACKAEGNRRKSRERMRKMREKRPGGCYDLPPPKA